LDFLIKIFFFRCCNGLFPSFLATESWSSWYSW